VRGTRRECLLIRNDGPDAAKEVDADAVLAPTGAACRRGVYCQIQDKRWSCLQWLR